MEIFRIGMSSVSATAHKGTRSLAGAPKVTPDTSLTIDDVDGKICVLASYAIGLSSNAMNE